MTTIAYKDGIIAYDSRETRMRETVSSDNVEKRFDQNGVSFFCTGNAADVKHLVAAYFDANYKAPDKTSCGAFIVDKGSVYRAGINEENGFWYDRAHNINAIGSGTDHALTAMDMGADAKTAVKMAAKRDVCTGGKIRTFKIK